MVAVHVRCIACVLQACDRELDACTAYETKVRTAALGAKVVHVLAHEQRRPRVRDVGRKQLHAQLAAVLFVFPALPGAHRAVCPRACACLYCTTTRRVPPRMCASLSLASRAHVLILYDDTARAPTHAGACASDIAYASSMICRL